MSPSMVRCRYIPLNIPIKHKTTSKRHLQYINVNLDKRLIQSKLDKKLKNPSIHPFLPIFTFLVL